MVCSGRVQRVSPRIARDWGIELTLQEFRDETQRKTHTRRFGPSRRGRRRERTCQRRRRNFDWPRRARLLCGLRLLPSVFVLPLLEPAGTGALLPGLLLVLRT